MPIELVPLDDFVRMKPNTRDVVDYFDSVSHIHQALAAPAAQTQLPAHPPLSTFLTDPTGVSYVLEPMIAYWEGLHYVLHYLIGWTNPAKGLAWFYQNGKSTEGDVRLQLIKEVWDIQEHLRLYAAWISNAGDYNPLPGALWVKVAPIIYPNVDRSKVELGAGWWEESERLIPNFKRACAATLGLGGNSLHLGRHFNMAFLHSLPRPNQTGPLFLQTDRDQRRAVLVLEALEGWYAELVRAGATLPALGNRSWHVEVFVKPVGWLGTFRQSRVTGLWFQGRHNIHMKGN